MNIIVRLYLLEFMNIFLLSDTSSSFISLSFAMFSRLNIMSSISFTRFILSRSVSLFCSMKESVSTSSISSLSLRVSASMISRNLRCISTGISSFDLSVSTNPLIEVSGVLSSWVTLLTKSRLRFSVSIIAVRSFIFISFPIIISFFESIIFST